MPRWLGFGGRRRLARCRFGLATSARLAAGFRILGLAPFEVSERALRTCSFTGSEAMVNRSFWLRLCLSQIVRASTQTLAALRSRCALRSLMPAARAAEAPMPGRPSLALPVSDAVSVTVA